MRILIIGSGGREHALVWKIAQSPLAEKIYCAPGNGGIADLAELVDIKADDVEKLLEFAIKEEIDFTVVGPEAPLAAGIVDRFREQGLKIFGPNKKASVLESSKVFAKELMKKYEIPTADFWIFSDQQAALDFVRAQSRPLVIKADGLCAGKGVFVCPGLEEQENAIKSIFTDKIFGTQANSIIIEELLEGEEASIIVISDSINFVTMASSQDHKRIFDDDQGPNTGGMGAYSPAPVIDSELLRKIQTSIISPTIQGMRKEGSIFSGVLYAGIMVTASGPKVLEFNVRFGDPETQAILPRLKSDLLQVLMKAEQGKLSGISLDWDERDCVCVVLASGGYPGNYEKGKAISGLNNFENEKDVVVFHAGTKKENGRFLTSGGRVLGVTGLGANIKEAMEKTYSAVSKISFDKMFFRRDIAARALNRENK